MAANVASELLGGFRRIRGELELPAEFPPDVEAAAAEAAAQGPAPLADGTERLDRRATPFLTLDPPESRDLDQALALEREQSRIVLRYAIADVGAFAPIDGPVDSEAWRRGETVYAPDRRAPLYPTSLSEGAASLLPDCDRAAFVFTIPVAPDGTAHLRSLERAIIRSRAKRAYGEVASRPIPLLEEVGERLAEAARRRGAVELHLPDTEVVRDESNAGYRLVVEERAPSSDWNAQLSLVTNMLVGELLLRNGVGLLRTMAPIDEAELEKLRRIADALAISWPHDVAFSVLADSVIPATPHAVAFLRAARRAMGRASYEALPLPDRHVPTHAAVGAPYAHATAPMRRLADRYVLETASILATGAMVPDGWRSRLKRLPEVMDRADSRAGRLDARGADLVEAAMLSGHEGDVFEATVTSTNGSEADVQFTDPPVRLRVKLGTQVTAGDVVRVRVVRADVGTAKVELQGA